MSSVTTPRTLTRDILSTMHAGESLLRNPAKEAFEKTGLPALKSEEYKFTPIANILDKNFDFTKQNPENTATSVKSQLPLDALSTINVVNGVINFNASETKGLTIQLLDEEKHKQYLGKLQNNQDALNQWNLAVWQSGVFIKAEEGVSIDKPILINHFHDTTQGEIKSFNRIVVVCEKGSKINIIENYSSEGISNGFSSLVSEIFVDTEAEFNLTTIQNDSGNRYLYNHPVIHQADSSRVNFYTFSLTGKLIRNNLNITLDGENCEAHMYGLYLLEKDTLADNHTVVDHRKPNSMSNELYKGIMDGNSRGVFNGKIFVRPQAQKTNAFQSNRNVILSDQATVHTKPQLEIWADDVKCSHGCTSGQLDEEALFYLRARGIKESTAKAMLLYAFAGELLETIPDNDLRGYIDSIISERLHKNF